jgi:hypothetical protein
MSTKTYAVPFRGTTLYVTHTPGDRWGTKCRANLPGIGTAGLHLSTVIGDVAFMWEADGAPLSGQYYGFPEPVAATPDEIVALGKPYEQDRLREIFARAS